MDVDLVEVDVLLVLVVEVVDEDDPLDHVVDDVEEVEVEEDGVVVLEQILDLF